MKSKARQPKKAARVSHAERLEKKAKLIALKKAAGQTLLNCPDCGLPNFTERGLKTHRKSRHCKRKTLSTMTPADNAILHLDPRKLSLAPELAAVPMTGAVVEHLRPKAKAAEVCAELSGEREATWQSLDEIGIQEPIKVTLIEPNLVNGEPSFAPNKGIVWDGRHRLEWALARGKEAVPVIAVTEDVGRKLMEASVIGRRHWTKGQRAYLGVQLHPEVAGVKRTDSLKRGKSRSDSVGTEETATSLAARLGVSADVVSQAVTLFKLFHAPGCKPDSAEAIEAADLRAKYEMSIWAGAGLGAVIAGCGGGKATHGKERADTSWAALDKPLGTMTRLSGLWDKWDEGDRSKALKLMTTRIKSDFSPSFRLALSEALAAADDSLA